MGDRLPRVWRRAVEATDATGTTVGRFTARGVRRGAPGLLLFAAFVVRGLAKDAGATAGAATSGG